MRIWDISPDRLCRNHLLGEHRELHAIWVILTMGRKGYCRHPEVLRWKGKLKALYRRHEKLVREFGRRGYKHYSDLDKRRASGSGTQNEFVDSYASQVSNLKGKRCGCRLKSDA